MEPRASSRPLISAGIVIGAGLGGFVDGIVFHQILQWHNMLSGRILPDNLIDAKVNMVWDGIFHAAVWMMTVVGIFMLWRAATLVTVPMRGKVLFGSSLIGWGLFNLVEGTIDHLILGIHHVNDYAPNKLPYDLAFLASGAILVAAGWYLVRSSIVEREPRPEPRLARP